MKELFDELLEVFAAGGRGPNTTEIPDFLCSGFELPNKEDAVKEKQTRFAKFNDL